MAMKQMEKVVEKFVYGASHQAGDLVQYNIRWCVKGENNETITYWDRVI